MGRLRCELVRVKPAHIHQVAARMRRVDRDELWAASHSLPGEALERAQRTAIRSWTGMVNGQPVCMMGVSPLSILYGEGSPWLLCTDAIAKVERPFLRLSRPVVDAMLEVCPSLVNWVDARNLRAIAWLRWLGFTVEDPAPHGVEGLPFHRFSRTSHV